MKEAGRLRYTGVTTSHGRRHDALEEVMRRRPLDFVQLTYNIVDREAERRLLPLAEERGIAVICNRPFQRGRLPDRLAGRPLPGWAGEIGVVDLAAIPAQVHHLASRGHRRDPRDAAGRPCAREQVRPIRPHAGRRHAREHGGLCARPVGPCRTVLVGPAGSGHAGAT